MFGQVTQANNPLQSTLASSLSQRPPTCRSNQRSKPLRNCIFALPPTIPTAKKNQKRLHVIFPKWKHSDIPKTSTLPLFSVLLKSIVFSGISVQARYVPRRKQEADLHRSRDKTEGNNRALQVRELSSYFISNLSNRRVE